MATVLSTNCYSKLCCFQNMTKKVKRFSKNSLVFLESIDKLIEKKSCISNDVANFQNFSPRIYPKIFNFKVRCTKTAVGNITFQ